MPIFGDRRAIVSRSRKPLAVVMLAIIVLCGAPSAGVAQVSEVHRWGAVTLFNGMPSDRVYAVGQDDTGAIYAGTEAGLARFDGRRAERFPSGALPEGPVRAIARWPGGGLCVGGDWGAAVLLAGSVTVVDALRGRPVTAFASDAGGATAVTRDGAIVLFRPSDGAIEGRIVASPETSPLLRLADGSPLPLTSVAPGASERELLVGSRGRGLLRVSGGAVSEVETSPRPFFVNALLAAPSFLTLGADAGTTAGGLFAFDGDSTLARLDAGRGPVTALARHNGSVWVATAGGGVAQIRSGGRTEIFTFQSTAGGLRSDVVAAVFADREGVIWFGTDHGLCRFDPASPRVVPLGDGADANFVRCILGQSGEGPAFCGTNAGLFAILTGGRARSVTALEGRAVYAVTRSGGSLFVGTGAGLFRSDDGETFRSVAEPGAAPTSVRSLATFRDSVYAACFGRGVERVEAEALMRVGADGDSSLPPDVVCVRAEGDLRLWVGSASAGPFAYDGAHVTRPPGVERLAGAAVWDIAFEHGAVWIASSLGLFRYSGTTLDAVVPGIEARAVCGDGMGGIWCGTEHSGLLRVRVENDVLTSRLDRESGLPARGVFALAPGLVGTSAGLVEYAPGTVAPGLAFETAVGSRPFTIGEIAAGPVLDYPQRSLVVSVAAVSSRTAPGQFTYEFSATGPGNAPLLHKVSGEPALALTGLAPGEYELRARTFSADLVASEFAILRFTVARAPFPWFVLLLSTLLGVALAALGWGVWQNRRLGRSNAQLASTRARLADETERERGRIARDLHDQTLADLRRLMLLSDELAGGESGGETRLTPAAFRHEIEAVSNEIRRICEDLSPSVLSNIGLAAALEWALASAVPTASTAERFTSNFLSEPELDERLALAPEQEIQVFRIVQEALSNAARHARAKTVELRATAAADGSLDLTLDDDGIGFDPSSRALRRGRGLENIETRASLIGASVRWSARPTGGTRFELHVPPRASTAPPRRTE